MIAEKTSYRPGEVARQLVKSPWERAQALVTIERGGVNDARLLALEGTMPVVEIPVVEGYAPNVLVSVVLMRGRVDAPASPEVVDPGRPQYRIGYAELTVSPAGRRLAVEATSAKAEYPPGQTASMRVKVAAEDGAPRRASVTLWAVDAGVLALTGYRAPPSIDSSAQISCKSGFAVGLPDEQPEKKRMEKVNSKKINLNILLTSIFEIRKCIRV